MKNKIYLDKKRRAEALCNREEYFMKYSEFDKQGCFKKIVNGAPVILNIDGHYYYFDKLPVCRGSEDLYEDYRRGLKNPTNIHDRVFFIWR